MQTGQARRMMMHEIGVLPERDLPAVTYARPLFKVLPPNARAIKRG
jgi:hypothetical protein